MANKRPPLQVEELTETLKESKGKGMGAFFPTPPPKQDAAAQTASSNEPPESKIITPSESKEKNRADEKTKDGDTDVVTSVRQDVALRAWRDIIENTETRGSTLRLTNDEAYAVEDVIKELERRLKIKTSLNEAARLGLLYIIDDFKKHKEKSLIYKVKKS